MNKIEMAVLGIVLFSAAILCVIAIVGDMEERDFEWPIPMPPPLPPPYQGRHTTDGETTRLRPPPPRSEN